jgi:hypothetical protein
MAKLQKTIIGLVRLKNTSHICLAPRKIVVIDFLDVEWGNLVLYLPSPFQ